MNITDVIYFAKHINGGFFTGARGQSAFSKIGSLKNSMNQANGKNDLYNYKSPAWEFYLLDSMTLETRRVQK